MIKQIRQQWKNVEILVRGDSAYSRDDTMTWYESQMGVDYIFGLALNSCLIGMTRTTQSLETMFKLDEKLAEFAGDLINNSTWYKSLDYKTRES